jgi:predicted RNA binding protein with dsRBD fold (UPF0201 family)
MSNFNLTAPIAISLLVATATSAFATPTGNDRLVSSYVNPTSSTVKVENAIANIQNRLEIKCSNSSPKKEAICDKTKYSNFVLVQLRNTKNIRITIANLAKVNPSKVTKAQITELGYYQEVLRFQSGQNNGQISETAQSMLEGFDLISFD